MPLVASLPHDKGRADVAYDELGYPYAAPRHFVVKKDEAGRMTVEFAPDTIDMLSSYMLPDRGCPARSLYPYGPELGSILRLGWISIVDILLLTGAEL